MRKRGFTTVKQYVLGIFLVLLSLFVSAAVLFYVAISPRIEMKAQAEMIAKRDSDMLSIRGFDIFHGQKTYYSVSGVDTKGEQILVIIDAETQANQTYLLSEGVDQKEAKELAKKAGAKQIRKVRPGFYKERVIWEVFADTGYYWIDFKTGEQVEVEK